MKRTLQLVPLKLLHYFAKLNALLPFQFRFDGQQIQANSSTKCIYYSIIIFAIILLAISWSNYHMLLIVFSNSSNKNLLNFASYFVSSVKTLVYSILQLTQNHRLVNIINKTQRLHVRIQEVFQKKAIDPYKPLQKSQHLLTWKLIAVFVQLLLVAFLCISMPLSYRIDYVSFVVIVTNFYIPVISVLVSCMFFFGLLVMWQFYAKLNALIQRSVEELRSMMESTNMGSHARMTLSCSLSDELDKLSMLYGDVNKCTKTIVDIFAIQIVTQFAYAVICITIEVGTCDLPDFHFYNIIFLMNTGISCVVLHYLFSN